MSRMELVELRRSMATKLDGKGLERNGMDMKRMSLISGNHNLSATQKYWICETFEGHGVQDLRGSGGNLLIIFKDDPRI